MKLYSTKETAEILKVSTRAIRKWKKQRKIAPAFVNSRGYDFYSEEQIEEILKLRNEIQLRNKNFSVPNVPSFSAVPNFESEVPKYNVPKFVPKIINGDKFYSEEQIQGVMIFIARNKLRKFSNLGTKFNLGTKIFLFLMFLAFPLFLTLKVKFLSIMFLSLYQKLSMVTNFILRNKFKG